MTTPETATILVVEDEASIRRFLQPTLRAQGYSVLEASTAREAMELFRERRLDMILLDLGLPDADGLEVLARIRENSTIPVIILTARDREGDKVRGLDAGADDYLTKPFGVDELTARIRVALRHARKAGNGENTPVHEYRDLRVNLATRIVHFQDREVHLTPQEFDVLEVLVRHAGKVVTQQRILREVWGHASHEQEHYVRLYIHQLRSKLEADSARPVHITTEPGVGYRLRAE